jgi:hypothetical protein
VAWISVWRALQYPLVTDLRQEMNVELLKTEEGFVLGWLFINCLIVHICCGRKLPLYRQPPGVVLLWWPFSI